VLESGHSFFAVNGSVLGPTGLRCDEIGEPNSGPGDLQPDNRVRAILITCVQRRNDQGTVRGRYASIGYRLSVRERLPCPVSRLRFRLVGRPRDLLSEIVSQRLGVSVNLGDQLFIPSTVQHCALATDTHMLGVPARASSTGLTTVFTFPRCTKPTDICFGSTL
jgi:hypothetical protein